MVSKLNPSVETSFIIFFENTLDPDQMASYKATDLDLHCFLLCLKTHAYNWNVADLQDKLARSVVHKFCLFSMTRLRPIYSFSFDIYWYKITM